MSKVLTLKEKILDLRSRYFPERQLFLRSEGRVRFVTIGTNTQITASAITASFLIWGAVTTYAYLTRDMMLEEKNQTISSMSEQYQNLSSNLSALEVQVENRAQQLEERQKFLEEVVGSKVNVPLILAPEMAPASDENDTKATENDQTSLLDMLMGSAQTEVAELSASDRRQRLIARLRAAEKNQNHLAERLLDTVNKKLAAVDAALVPTKIDQDDLMQVYQEDESAMGGPYRPDTVLQPVFDSQGSSVFTDLMDTWQRLQIVTFMLDSFPVGKPAENYYISSRFGRRRDPIKKTWANHPGLDLAGWTGTAIMATAPGTVVYSGWFGPYGKMIEIDHGNSLKTRYGHMRKLLVKKGETVKLGDQIGEMGKTGRVTGTHLHYEIWFEGKVRDPLPFLKAANDVLKVQGRHEKDS